MAFEVKRIDLCLALPLIQSTSVLLSLLISSWIPSPF